MPKPKKSIWKLLIFFYAVWWSLYVIVAPNSALGTHTHAHSKEASNDQETARSSSTDVSTNYL